MIAPDFESYRAAQSNVDHRWANQPAWWHSAIVNTASVSWSSSDRTIREYAKEIWNAPLNV